MLVYECGQHGIAVADCTLPRLEQAQYDAYTVACSEERARKEFHDTLSAGLLGLAVFGGLVVVALATRRFLKTTWVMEFKQEFGRLLAPRYVAMFTVALIALLLVFFLASLLISPSETIIRR